MTVLVAAVLLPVLFWDAGPQAAPALRNARIERVFVPAKDLDDWRAVSGIRVEAADPQRAIKLVTPSVNYRMYDATATQAPWINSNGWRYLRNPGSRFFVEASGAPASLAAAEAFVFGGDTMIHTDAAGLMPLGEMLAFLKTIGDDRLPAAANIAFVDDGSPASGERMNMLIVRNLLFRRVTEPVHGADLNVRIGSKDYPDAAWRNPDLLAHIVRSKLTDDKRLVRLFGSEVVIARLAGTPERRRVHLLNYAAGTRGVAGVRVRVLGRYRRQKICAFGLPNAQLADVVVDGTTTEFTVPQLKTYAVIDLSQ